MQPSNRRSRALKELRWATLVCLTVLPAVSCSDGVTGPSDVVGGVWRLSSMRLAGSTSTFVPADPSRFTVEFREDGFIGLQADCNQCGGRYSLSEDRLVTDLACTLMACADDNGGEFSNLIAGTASIDESDGTLRMASPEGTIVLTR